MATIVILISSEIKEKESLTMPREKTTPHALHPQKTVIADENKKSVTATEILRKKRGGKTIRKCPR